MKVAEKLYIERLEGMMKKHKGDPCPHCPMSKYYSINKDIIFVGIYDYTPCEICVKLTDKYAHVECNQSLLLNVYCPCTFFRDYFHGCFGTESREMPKDYMSKVAWKVIRGWKKDNEIHGGGE